MNRSQTPPAIPGRTVSEVLSGSRVSKPTIRPCVNVPRGGWEKGSGLPRGCSYHWPDRAAGIWGCGSPESAGKGGYAVLPGWSRRLSFYAGNARDHGRPHGETPWAGDTSIDPRKRRGVDPYGGGNSRGHADSLVEVSSAHSLSRGMDTGAGIKPGRRFLGSVDREGPARFPLSRPFLSRGAVSPAAGPSGFADQEFHRLRAACAWGRQLTVGERTTSAAGQVLSPMGKRSTKKQPPRLWPCEKGSSAAFEPRNADAERRANLGVTVGRDRPSKERRPDGSMWMRIQQGETAHRLREAQGQGAAEGQQEVAAPNAGRQGVTAARVRHSPCRRVGVLAANP